MHKLKIFKSNVFQIGRAARHLIEPLHINRNQIRAKSYYSKKNMNENEQYRRMEKNICETTVKQHTHTHTHEKLLRTN